jgi:signal recognition particle receptor subunit beta
MVLFNYSTKELTAKVVYYGPGLCGKTTNLQWIHEKIPIKNKGKMLSLATETDRTLFFDFLPIELGTIRGMKTRVQLYTVPGQVFYNATRRMVLKGADCVVFVVDSQEAMVDANLESLENLRENLRANDIDPAEMPIVLQYNKRDLPNALSVEKLNQRINTFGAPWYEAVAVKGIGVEETLKGVTALVFKSLAGKYGGGQVSGPTPAPPPSPRVTQAVKVEAPPPPPPPQPEPSHDALLDSLDMAAPAQAEPASMAELDLQPMPDDRTAPVMAEISVEPAPAARTEELPSLSLDDLAPHPEPAAEQPLQELSLTDEPEPAPEPIREPAPAPTLEVVESPAVEVSVPASAATTGVAVPIEVTLHDGKAKVQIQIHLTLHIKLQ